MGRKELLGAGWVSAEGTTKAIHTAIATATTTAAWDGS
jgi:hypothetical protein